MTTTIEWTEETCGSHTAEGKRYDPDGLVVGSSVVVVVDGAVVERQGGLAFGGRM